MVTSARHTFDALAAEIVDQCGNGRVVVAINGLDGAGKTHFAVSLAEAIARLGRAVFTASIDDFQQQPDLIATATCR